MFLRKPATNRGWISRGNERGINYEQMSNEFYEVLGISLTGEALTIVRGVHDMNGMEA